MAPPATNLMICLPKNSCEILRAITTGKAYISRSVFLLILLASSVRVITVAGQDDGSMQMTQGSDLNITNHSISSIGNTGNFAQGQPRLRKFVSN